MSGSTSSGRGPNSETDVMGHNPPPALQKMSGSSYHNAASLLPRVIGRESAWRSVFRVSHKNGTLTHGRANCLDRELPKNGDVPKSPLPENGSLMPSAGVISS